MRAKLIREVSYAEGIMKIVECVECKEEVALYPVLINTCIECGTTYNAFGQELSPVDDLGMEFDCD